MGSLKKKILIRILVFGLVCTGIDNISPAKTPAINFKIDRLEETMLQMSLR